MNGIEVKRAGYHAFHETLARAVPPPAQAPGASAHRFVGLMRRAIAATGLDLSGMNILTEAATGAYGVTAVIAAMAGARRVHAFARRSPYGSVAEIRAWTQKLAGEAGVAGRIDITESLSPQVLSHLDIVTNSGLLRPLTAALIESLPQSAVIALMFEAWELRPGDIDLHACARRGIPVVGVNERHAAIDVFSFLGPLCIKELHDCGLPVYGNRIALICDNDFDEPILRGLEGLRAHATCFPNVGAMPADDWDAVVIALKPSSEPRIGPAECRLLLETIPQGAPIVQFWGDIDREAARSLELNLWPPCAPAPGHMAVLLSDIGPDAIVRLQTGGLRAAEWIRRGGAASPDGFAQIVPTP